MKLSEILPGQRFTVSRVIAAGEIGRRLADMGFTKDASGEMIRGAFMRGPVQVRLRGYDLLIRRSEASYIEVEPDTPSREKTLRVALSGNPNAGKTSLFNALTGAHHKVGNYPGVTVEKREGIREYKGFSIHFIDLPGTYSLTAYSLDEVVARDFVLEEKPDIVIDVLDSTTLERSLALCLQFQELGTPLIGALNMSDEAEQKGIHIDIELLSATLGIPLVKTVGTVGKGAETLLDAIIATKESARPSKLPHYGTEVESKLAPLQEALAADTEFAAKYPIRWFAIKLLENDADAMARLSAHKHADAIISMATSARDWLGKHFGKDSEIAISEQRYGYIRGALKEAVRQDPGQQDKESTTSAIDKLLMNQFLGLPVFLLIMWGMFKLTFALGQYPTSWLESLFSTLGAAAQAAIPPGYLQSLVVNGIIGGVGGVFSFIPLIVILFFCLSILEDVGYMSRAAFLTDKALHAFGLHGQSFMPLVLGFGCSVPAIMAARTLKSPRDRIATILAVPFMSCGAKLPVYVLLAGAFFPKNPGNAVMAIYLAGVLLSLISTKLLRSTVLKGPTTPFVMELPPYRKPTARGIAWHVWEKTWQYTKKAGTIILAASVLIWIITTFPSPPDKASLENETKATLAAQQPQAADAALAAMVNGAMAERKLEYSIAGRIGKFIEPAIAPLGFTWKIGVATVTGFAAKEVIVSTLGILYNADSGDNTGEGNISLREALRKDPAMNPLTAITLMLVILIMPPCVAALAALKAEAGWKWLGFEMGYGIVLAWIAGFIVHSLGTLIGIGA